jgi:hypothetical protein
VNKQVIGFFPEFCRYDFLVLEQTVERHGEIGKTPVDAGKATSPGRRGTIRDCRQGHAIPARRFRH